MKATDKGKKLLFGLVCILLIAIVIYSGFRFLETTVFLEEAEDTAVSQHVSKTIEWNGVKYFPKQDIETYLVIGVDEQGPMVKQEYYSNTGMADAIMVLIFDKGREVVDVVSLNRDTMTDVRVLGIDGKPAGTRKEQLAISYAYGDGMERSCENTMATVSAMLNGIELDHFVAMNMDAIKVLNDAVGGVTVNVTEDFSAVDSSIQMGEMTLHGDQALTYIRARKDVGTQLNVSRMERQRGYMESFFSALKAKVGSDMAGEFVVDTYEALDPYMVTDCSVTVMSSMLERYSAYELGRMVTPEGENKKGTEYIEFYLDEEAFDQLVIDMFYAEKK